MRWLFVAVVFLSACSAQKGHQSTDAISDSRLLTNLKSHVAFLADDRLEGRQAGSKGEELAMRYIAEQYDAIGLQPKGSNGYIQDFEIKEGKQVAPGTYFTINGKQLELNKEYFPLAFSANTSAKGSPAISVREGGEPWFVDVRSWLEENRTSPHYDIYNAIAKEAERAAAKQATALIVYNSGRDVDNIQFNKNDTTPAASIPVLFITAQGLKKYLADKSESIDVDLSVKMTTKQRTARNVIGFIDNGATNTVILGAHYDHLGYGEDKNALDTGRVIHNGADDNASGTAALIELARILKRDAPKNNNYLFISFSGEELGLFGSKYWLQNPTVSVQPNYMINMDMVGRYDTARKLVVGGYGTSPLWGDLFTNTTNTNLNVKFDSSGSGPSDHASFYRKDIPVLFFFTGSHSDYHKASDDVEKINYDAQKEIVKYIYNIIRAADTKGKLAFTKTREPQMGTARFSVSLGVIPDYGYSGTGVRIDGVSPGKLAEKIGLKGGDVLLQLGDYRFVDVMTYMQTLSKFKKGDKTVLRIRRGENELEFNVEFQ